MQALGTLEAELPDNVFIKRLPKGWNTKEVMLSIAEILGIILQPFMQRFQPIVCFDTAPCPRALLLSRKPQIASRLNDGNDCDHSTQQTGVFKLEKHRYFQVVGGGGPEDANFHGRL